MQSLKNELQWLKQVMLYQISIHLRSKGVKAVGMTDNFPSPPVLEHQDAFDSFVSENKLSTEERLLLILGLSVHQQFDFFEPFIRDSFRKPIIYPDLGLSYQGSYHKGFIPTGETVLFLLSKPDQPNMEFVEELFNESQFLIKHNILWLEKRQDDLAPLSGYLAVNPLFLNQVENKKIALSGLFQELPVQLLYSPLNDDELVLDNHARKQLQQLQSSINQHRHAKPEKNEALAEKGILAVFAGDKGTGKTLAAILTGKKTGHALYRIDMSLVASKYIGETEKNLSQLFRAAEKNSWILYFDEADALFGKRTNVKDAHDRYANQEISYLLQQIDKQKLIIIISVSTKSILDKELLDRCDAVIHFQSPTTKVMYRLWKRALPQSDILNNPSDKVLQSISKHFDIPAGIIPSVVQGCVEDCFKRKHIRITSAQIISGIQREVKRLKEESKHSIVK